MAKKTKNKSYMDRLKTLRQKVVDKFNEEVEQYKSMGGIGEYVTHNMTSLQSKIAWRMGDDEAAQRIEARREKLVAQGKKFDEMVESEVDGIMHLEEASITFGKETGPHMKLKPFSRKNDKIALALSKSDKEK